MRKRPLLFNILKKIAPKIGAKVLYESRWGIVGQITFKSGKRSYIRYNTLDINSLGASEIAVDKDYAAFFMRSMGYPTIPGKAFPSPAWAQAIGAKESIDAAYKYAEKIGFPVIVKPNSKSQGKGVTFVGNKTEFYKSLKKIFTYDNMALVQKHIIGHDYRLVVLDKEVISAYERMPLSVRGDGRSTILKLLKEKQRAFNAIKRDIKIDVDDPRIKNKLKRQNLTINSIIKKGEKAYLLDNANLSTGGDSIDVTSKVHTSFKKLAVNLTKDMGLRLCGVDIMIDGEIDQSADTVRNYWIIEINAAPGLDHYVTTGKAQQKIVENLYLKVLKSMGK
jgi:D-alanine-D-alanine ligase-like ATP-grasp enzyme